MKPYGLLGVLVGAALSLAACSSDSPPSDAMETELSVVMTMGAFDPNFGRTGETILFVTVDSEEYRLEIPEGSAVFGFEEIMSDFDLGGRRALIAGDIVDGVYIATYVELLPAVKPAVDPVAQGTVAEDEALQAELSQVAALLTELYERQALLMQQGSDAEPLQVLREQIQETEERYLQLYEILDPEFVNRARAFSE